MDATGSLVTMTSTSPLSSVGSMRVSRCRSLRSITSVAQCAGASVVTSNGGSTALATRSDRSQVLAARCAQRSALPRRAATTIGPSAFVAGACSLATNTTVRDARASATHARALNAPALTTTGRSTLTVLRGRSARESRSRTIRARCVCRAERDFLRPTSCSDSKRRDCSRPAPREGRASSTRARTILSHGAA